MRLDTDGIGVLPDTVASHNGQRLEAMASVAPQSLANEHGKGHSADSPGRGGGGMLVGHALLVVVQVVALTMHLASQGSVQDNPRCAQAVVEAGKGLRVRPAGGLGLRRQTRGRKVLFPLVAERDPADRAPASSLWTVINGNLACSRNDEGIEQMKGSDYGTTLEACKATCLQKAACAAVDFFAESSKNSTGGWVAWCNLYARPCKTPQGDGHKGSSHTINRPAPGSMGAVLVAMDWVPNSGPNSGPNSVHKATAAGAGGEEEKGQRQRPGAAKPRVLVLIPTRYSDVGRRDLLRKTWINKSKTGSMSPALMVDVEVLFVVGNAVSTALTREDPLRDEAVCINATALDMGPVQENRRHRDIVFLSVLDSAMTIKSVASFEWAYHNRPGVDFVIKADSDTYIYWPRFSEYLLASIAHHTSVVVGRAHPNLWTLGHPYEAKVGGELYGCSWGCLDALMRLALQSVGTLQGLLMLMLSHLGQYRKDTIVFTPNNTPQKALAAQTLLLYHHEDYAVSILFHAMPAQWMTLDFKQARHSWVHGGRLKRGEYFLHCHQTGDCGGSDSNQRQKTHMTFPRYPEFGGPTNYTKGNFNNIYRPVKCPHSVKAGIDSHLGKHANMVDCCRSNC